MSFDDMCRLVASGVSRRRIFQMLGGSLAAAAMPRKAEAGTVIKRVTIHITQPTHTACTALLNRRKNAVTCPKGTTKQIQGLNGSVVCVKFGHLWVAHLIVRCIRGPICP